MAEHSRVEEDVSIPMGNADLAGTLTISEEARGVVLFAHGSGSSRFSLRNRYVAGVLNDAGFGTLLMDLLTPEEESVDNVTRELRFDIPMLGRRLVGAVDWLRSQPATRLLPIGLFGASTGAAAALIAAFERSEAVRAVLSRGGRPDLANAILPHVQAPTLLIVGGRDTQVITLNERARESMRGTVELAIVPGATHLFEEPGALEEVARLAAAWFTEKLKV